jgi:hypothetical protein
MRLEVIFLKIVRIEETTPNKKSPSKRKSLPVAGRASHWSISKSKVIVNELLKSYTFIKTLQKC